MRNESAGGVPWISVDGVEGVGKTTISRRVATASGAHLAPEFSAAAFGRALRQVVRTDPQFISADPIGQSLVFLGDFFEVHASEVAPRLAAGTPVISDRGYLSKYAYQEVVLSDALGRDAARRLLDSVFAHMRTPDLTIHLAASPDALRARLLERDGHCDDERLAFMARARRACAEHLERQPNLPSVTVDADRPVDEVAAEVMDHVTGLLTVTRRT